MSTNDVPGFDPKNADELKALCWAEHGDGSLILVESTEGNRVIYSIFDMAKNPPIEYRDAMPEMSFKTTFSYGGKSKEKWTWHDKTPFPWDKIIKTGYKDGAKLPSAEHILTAAERVAESLRLHGSALDRNNFDHRMDHVLSRVEGMWDRIVGAVQKHAKPDSKPKMPPKLRAKVRKRAGARL